MQARIVLVALLTVSICAPALADEWVNPYMRKPQSVDTQRRMWSWLFGNGEPASQTDNTRIRETSASRDGWMSVTGLAPETSAMYTSGQASSTSWPKK